MDETENTEQTSSAQTPSDQAPPVSSQSAADNLNDPRFEVKWRKKAAPPPASPQLDGPPAAQASEPAQSDEVADLRRQLEEEQTRNKELQDRWHRAAADMANLRKRHEAERADMEKLASMRLAAELLPVLDNFERAVATIPGNLAMLTWIHGIMLIERHMRAILEAQGVTPMESKGQQFDPRLHEAVSEQETADALPGTIVSEYQRGYSMHGYVIRPALVELAKAPTAAQTQQETPPQPTPQETEPEGEEIAEEAREENVGP